MKRIVLSFALLCFVCTVPTGCKTHLATGGVYQGDPVLYNADKVITSSYRILHEFVSWEYKNRAVLPVEVSRAADAVRENASKYTDSAIRLREIYSANPDKSNAGNLTKAVEILQGMLDEATRYMTAGPPKSLSNH